MSVRNAKEQDGCYTGNLTQLEIEAITNIRNSDNILNLKKMIYDFPEDYILKSIEEKRSIKDLIHKEELPIPNSLYGELKEKQTVAVAFMYWSKRSLLGDAVGSGKTVVVAGLINFLMLKEELNRFIFFADSSTSASQVQKELIRFTGLNIGLLPSQKQQMNRYIKSVDINTLNGIVTTHSALKSDNLMNWLSEYIENNKSSLFDTVFLDESSVIKNQTTKVFRYADILLSKVDRVHFLNATAFETCIMDIYNQIDLLRNELLPKKWRIEEHYCTFKNEPYWVTVNGKPTQKYARKLSDYKNQDEFKEKLKLVYFGRSKKELGLDTQHEYKVYVTYPTDKQQHEIQRGYNYQSVLNCPTLIENTKIKFNKEEVPKLRLLIDLLSKEFIGKTVLIYCFNIDAMNIIKEECIKIGLKAEIINGSSTNEERIKIKDNFNNHNIDIVITNVQRSLNMYGGDVCIWYTYTGNPAKMEQVRGRIDRNVDNSVKTFVLLLYKGTAEYKFFTDVAGKRARDGRELTIDTDTCLDYFIKEIENNKEELRCY